MASSAERRRSPPATGCQIDELGDLAAADRAEVGDRIAEGPERRTGPGDDGRVAAHHDQHLGEMGADAHRRVHQPDAPVGRRRVQPTARSWGDRAVDRHDATGPRAGEHAAVAEDRPPRRRPRPRQQIPTSSDASATAAGDVATSTLPSERLERLRGGAPTA